ELSDYTAAATPRGQNCLAAHNDCERCVQNPNCSKSQRRHHQPFCPNRFIDRIAIDAVSNSSIECSYLSDSKISLNSSTESAGDTPLTLACLGGYEDAVLVILSECVDLERRDKKGLTPLMVSCTAGHLNIVQVLVAHGSDLEACVDKTRDTSLSLSASTGQTEIVAYLLNVGANREHRNSSDYTPLCLASSGGFVDTVQVLVSAGADINSRTNSKLGITPLMLSAMNGHIQSTKLLLELGADINAQIETNKNTALTLACYQGRYDVVKLLIEYKANIEHRAKTGLTPLMEAASGGFTEVGSVLIEKGADINAPPVPSSRDTPLTIAADRGHDKFVQLLLDNNAYIDAKNKKSATALWLAANGGHNDVVQLLVNNGATVDVEDARRISVLMAAFKRGHVKIVKFLVRHVRQFPSDAECLKFISSTNDKELQKRCKICMDVILAAKDRQTLEADKAASNLLAELSQEKSREESKKQAAAKKRARKRLKRQSKKQQFDNVEIEQNQEPPVDDANDEVDNKDEENLARVPSIDNSRLVATNATLRLERENLPDSPEEPTEVLRALSPINIESNGVSTPIIIFTKPPESFVQPEPHKSRKKKRKNRSKMERQVHDSNTIATISEQSSALIVTGDFPAVVHTTTDTVTSKSKDLKEETSKHAETPKDRKKETSITDLATSRKISTEFDYIADSVNESSKALKPISSSSFKRASQKATAAATTKPGKTDSDSRHSADEWTEVTGRQKKINPRKESSHIPCSNISTKDDLNLSNQSRPTSSQSSSSAAASKSFADTDTSPTSFASIPRYRPYPYNPTSYLDSSDNFSDPTVEIYNPAVLSKKTPYSLTSSSRVTSSSPDNSGQDVIKTHGSYYPTDEYHQQSFSHPQHSQVFSRSVYGNQSKKSDSTNLSSQPRTNYYYHSNPQYSQHQRMHYRPRFSKEWKNIAYSPVHSKIAASTSLSSAATDYAKIRVRSISQNKLSSTTVSAGRSITNAPSITDFEAFPNLNPIKDTNKVTPEKHIKSTDETFIPSNNQQAIASSTTAHTHLPIATSSVVLQQTSSASQDTQAAVNFVPPSVSLIRSQTVRTEEATNDSQINNFIDQFAKTMTIATDYSCNDIPFSSNENVDQSFTNSSSYTSISDQSDSSTLKIGEYKLFGNEDDVSNQYQEQGEFCQSDIVSILQGHDNRRDSYKDQQHKEEITSGESFLARSNKKIKERLFHLSSVGLPYGSHVIADDENGNSCSTASITQQHKHIIVPTNLTDATTTEFTHTADIGSGNKAVTTPIGFRAYDTLSSSQHQQLGNIGDEECPNQLSKNLITQCQMYAADKKTQSSSNQQIPNYSSHFDASRFASASSASDFKPITTYSISGGTSSTIAATDQLIPSSHHDESYSSFETNNFPSLLSNDRILGYKDLLQDPQQQQSMSRVPSLGHHYQQSSLYWPALTSTTDQQGSKINSMQNVMSISDESTTSVNAPSSKPSKRISQLAVGAPPLSSQIAGAGSNIEFSDLPTSKSFLPTSPFFISPFASQNVASNDATTMDQNPLQMSSIWNPIDWSSDLNVHYPLDTCAPPGLQSVNAMNNPQQQLSHNTPSFNLDHPLMRSSEHQLNFAAEQNPNLISPILRQQFFDLFGTDGNGSFDSSRIGSSGRVAPDTNSLVTSGKLPDLLPECSHSLSTMYSGNVDNNNDSTANLQMSTSTSNISNLESTLFQSFFNAGNRSVGTSDPTGQQFRQLSNKDLVNQSINSGSLKNSLFYGSTAPFPGQQRQQLYQSISATRPDNTGVPFNSSMFTSHVRGSNIAASPFHGHSGVGCAIKPNIGATDQMYHQHHQQISADNQAAQHQQMYQQPPQRQHLVFSNKTIDNINAGIQQNPTAAPSMSVIYDHHNPSAYLSAAVASKQRMMFSASSMPSGVAQKAHIPLSCYSDSARIAHKLDNTSSFVTAVGGGNIVLNNGLQQLPATQSHQQQADRGVSIDDDQQRSRRMLFQQQLISANNRYVNAAEMYEHQQQELQSSQSCQKSPFSQQPHSSNWINNTITPSSLRHNQQQIHQQQQSALNAAAGGMISAAALTGGRPNSAVMGFTSNNVNHQQFLNMQPTAGSDNLHQTASPNNAGNNMSNCINTGSVDPMMRVLMLRQQQQRQFLQRAAIPSTNAGHRPTLAPQSSYVVSPATGHHQSCAPIGHNVPPMVQQPSPQHHTTGLNPAVNLQGVGCTHLKHTRSACYILNGEIPATRNVSVLALGSS
ncbi:hypothetical protein GJ496_005992, partial [Pomphorhynchus laevis]